MANRKLSTESSCTSAPHWEQEGSFFDKEQTVYCSMDEPTYGTLNDEHTKSKQKLPKSSCQLHLGRVLIMDSPHGARHPGMRTLGYSAHTIWKYSIFHSFKSGQAGWVGGRPSFPDGTIVFQSKWQRLYKTLDHIILGILVSISVQFKVRNTSN